jgi:hypothetical protein
MECISLTNRERNIWAWATKGQRVVEAHTGVACGFVFNTFPLGASERALAKGKAEKWRER